MDFNQIFRDRTKSFSISIVKLLSPLPYSDALSIIRKQIIRSSTSVAANYRAVARARSDKDSLKSALLSKKLMKLNFGLKLLKNFNI